MRIDILPVAEGHVAGIAALCADLGWPSLADAATCRRVLTAPGVVARVAVTEGAVVGFGYGMGDGLVQSYLAQLAVAAPYRRRGIAKRLVKEVFDATGTQRMDLITDDETGAAPEFYRAFAHHERPGFRIYPQYTPPWGTPPVG